LKVSFIAQDSSSSGSDHVQGSGENEGSGQTASQTWERIGLSFYSPPDF